MEVYRILEETNDEIWDRLVEVKPTNGKKASQKEKFDYCIKKSFENGAEYMPGRKLQKVENKFGFYLERYKRGYDRYLSDKLQLENIVSEEIRKRYDNGKGNEFTSGKFYSVASSSRLAVSSFSENKDGIIMPVNKLNVNGVEETVSINFEEELAIPNMVGTPPQMDVKIETEPKNTYFIEVKCHEIFDNHKRVKLRWAYKDCDAFKKIKECLKLEKLDFQKKSIKTKKDKTEEFLALKDSSAANRLKFLTAKDFGCELKTYHFDFKQFLCHLMGIISYREEHPSEKIYFYYLFFKNDEINECGDFSKIYEELENEIEVIKKAFKGVFDKYNIDFGYCYNNQFSTLKSLENELRNSENVC